MTSVTRDGKPIIPPEDPQIIDRQVAARCLALSYQRLTVSVAMSVGVPLVFVGLMSPLFATGMVVRWLGIVWIGTAGRALLWLAWRRSGLRAEAFDPRGRRFVATTALAGIAWSGGALLVLVGAGPRESLMLAIMLLAISVIGSNSLAYHLSSALTFALVILCPAIAVLIGHPDAVVHVSGLALGVGTVALAAVMTHVHRQIGRAMRTEIRLAAAVDEAVHARAAAEDASRAKSAFLANISHELRTPLNAIIGYSELLQEEASDMGQAACVADLRRIEGASKHLLGLISEILDFSKIEAGRMALARETFSVAALVDAVAATTRGLVESNRNTLHVDCAADAGTMDGDPVKLRQVLFNLLGNAAKFTADGDVWLTVHREPDPAPGLLVFAVRDTGIGIAADTQARLFQPFSQGDASTTRRFGGTGLGLAISHRLCTMMGGSIGLDSQEGRGSCFTVRVPAVGPAAHAGREDETDDDRAG